MTSVKINDFNAFIDIKPFFDEPVKHKEETYKKFVEMSKNDDCSTWNLLNITNHHNYYKLICIDLSRQTNTRIPQQINFAGKLVEDDRATMFFIAKNQQKLF